MPNMSSTEVVGFCDNLLEFMEKNQAAVKAAGVDIELWKTELKTQKEIAVSTNADQENLKTQLKLKTAQTNAAIKPAYSSASTKPDRLVSNLPVSLQRKACRASRMAPISNL